MAERTKQEVLGKLFCDGAQALILNYGKVKYARHKSGYSFPYLEPGTNRTPAVSIPSLEGLVCVMGEFEYNTTLQIDPNSIIARKLSICVQERDQLSELFLVNSNFRGIIQVAQLPNNEVLQIWINRLDEIKEEYEKQGLRPNYFAISYSCGDSRNARFSILK